jgi:hypothetical protein
MPWRNDATPRNTMKPGNSKNSELGGKSGVLHGAHMGGHSDVAAPKTKTTPKPAPSPTSVSQLNVYVRTKNPTTGALDVPVRGTYKNKAYDIGSDGKITLNKEDTKQYFSKK